ncbi:MAG: hypothetical protein K2N51_05090 [Lachnospiraceae bacterium]|nr:hypothetical protein [Lachnospiraceae bacterium]
MIIIVEGIDRVGKTTLCEMIEERYTVFRRFRDDTKYVHSHLNREVNTEKINTLQNLIEAGFIDDIILDRYHITEFVYGAIERSYKNVDMYDIDRRLSVVGGPDYEVAEPDDLDNVDSAMMIDNKFHTDVVLIYVVPVDIKTSSGEHGYNLERHLKWYNDFYRDTLIKNKITVDYETLEEALEYIDELLGIEEDSEEPEVPEEPVEPSEDEEDEWVESVEEIHKKFANVVK